MKNMKRSLAFLFVFVLMLVAFTACQQPQKEHTHVFADATCTAPKTCECGATEGKALGHTYVDGKCACGAKDPNYAAHYHSYESVVTAPTCTEKGYTTFTCACGDSYTALEVAANGHSHTSVVTAPTCTEDGYTTYTCACGDTYTADVVTANGHSHNAVVTAPTCTKDGYTTYTCACGDTYTGNEVAAKGHTFIDSVCACGSDYVAPSASWILTTELKDGDLVLIGAPAYGKLLSALKVSSGSYYNKGVNYSVDDFSNVTDAEVFVVTINADGTYTFTSLTGDVIALAASFSSLNKDGEHKSWALTDRGDGTFLMKNTGRNLYLEWYNSKGNWSTYSAGNTKEYYLSFYIKDNSAHIHNHISAVTAPTCTEAGYTTYTCECGDNYKVDGAAASGHTYVDGMCQCGETDPDVHFHNYTAEITAPTCTAAGYTTYTCACGDTYTGDETEKLSHIDENLDVECDRAGCTSKVAPPANSTLSTYTANCLGSKVSTSNSYYVVGTITEVLDAKNGIFLVDDGTGETFYFRLPKDADGVSHASWPIKLVLGDKVQVYGKINKYSTATAPNGQYWPAMQSPVVTLLEQHAHDFTAIPATCSEPAFCACGQSHGEPLGCADTNSDNLCDDCGKNVNYIYEYVEIRTDNNSGVLDTTAGTYTWSNDNFSVQVVKETSSQLYSTAKDHMRVYKGNQFVLANKNSITVKTITVYLTNATQVTYFEKFLTGYTYTTDADNFTVTVEINSAETLTLTNTGSTTQIKGVEFGYEKPNA